MTDLAELIKFLVDRYPTHRFNLFNWQNTGGYEADINNVHGKGSDPLTAVLNLAYHLKITEDDFAEWRSAQPHN